MSWMIVMNTFAGVAGLASIAYLAWVAWICARDLQMNGRVPKRRPVRRSSPWTPLHSR